ncbi:MAG: hypothetical protein M1830_008364 [Pleopsidium flavum]|nr:MAG: hypothetical protein M1830_008364 [Pleopsidium flavum]
MDLSQSTSPSPAVGKSNHTDMNNDPASVMAGQTDEIGGHRTKRIKTEDTADLRGIYEPEPLNNTATDELSEGQSKHAVDSMDIDQVNGDRNAQVDIDALASNAAESAMEAFNDPTDSSMASRPTGTSINDSRHASISFEKGFRSRSQTSAPEIDFSSAPSDPTELAIWVAKQISNFRDEGRDSMDMDEDEERRKLMMHPPGMYNRRFDEDNDPIKVAERERVREENRARKKKWRESNTERNKDNDLRCRINKRAKKLYGMNPSAEKSAWMESEFNKRRNKRESKERLRSFDGSDFSGFSFASGLGNSLFAATENGTNTETNAAGLLLANALLGVGSSGTGPNAEAAKALTMALEGGKVDPRPFTEALRTMAMNPEIMSGINAVLGGGYSGYDDEGDTNSGDEGPYPLMQSTEMRGGAAAGELPVEVDEESSEIIKALNAATAILNEMNETRPGSNPAQARGSAVNGFTAINGGTKQQANGTPKSSSSKQSSNEHGLDQSQIDALLALANGGSLTDDEDDIPMTDVPDTASQQADRNSTPQPDSDITATLQRIVNQLMTERNGEGFAGPLDPSANRGMPIVTSQSDPYGLDSAKNPAAALQSLLHSAGVSINTVIPAAQSLATSQLYARLSNRARSSTPVGGGINPAHASAFGSTAQMNEKMFSKAAVVNRPLQTSNGSSSRANVVGPPLRLRSAEEIKKVKSYGFPPLPGSKLGIRKK